MRSARVPDLSDPARSVSGMTIVDVPLPVLGSLSPSRASDFMTCPLLFRFRTIDRLPQAPSSAATRGTMVHGVLERLFDVPSAERTPEAAAALLRPEWERLLTEQPELGELFADAAELETWLASAAKLLEGYFALEDPRRLEPAERETSVSVVLPGGLRLRGIVDRVDVAPSGAVRVVDYKTGRSPREAFEGKALFQMKFYALVLWRTRGEVPALLQLMYLGDRELLRYVPDEADLRATERKLLALWAAIERATQRREFPPSPSKLCGWCDHQALCPSFGGTPPPFPDVVPGPDELLPHQRAAAERTAARICEMSGDGGTPA
ncbi:MAG: RecB family exonuclease [Frankiales bacterium]|nr:RecB family exonuclease [Frankiales bacterium]